MRVLVLFGGRSGEHEVSVVSARAVADAVRAAGHECVPVGITRTGRWVRCDPSAADRVPDDGETYVLEPGPGPGRDVDVAFPVLHGPYGEDGCVQGLFELADLPYVGAGVEGSAIGMNKAVHKTLFRAAGLETVDFLSVPDQAWRTRPDEVGERVGALGFPCFTKPARLGSSVGISKVHEASELGAAMDRALVHDDLAVVEGAGGPRELEVGILEEADGELDVSVVGEVVPDGEFYDYRAKYKGEWTQTFVPADVPEKVGTAVADMARLAFRAAYCSGLARVDFFWDPASERLLVNEINSLPGITPASMFPMVWEASGRSLPQVVEHLIAHALARSGRRRELEAARLAAHDAETGA